MNLNYDVIFNYQSAQRLNLRRYQVIVLPNTNPLSKNWCGALGQWVHNDGGTLISVQDASLFSEGPASGAQDFGLGELLGISKENMPEAPEIRPQGKGRSIYLPSLEPAVKMVSLIRRYLKGSELVAVELPKGTLSNVSYQPEFHRVVLHLLNYRQVLEQNIKVRVRATVERADVLSPDSLNEKQARVQSYVGKSEIVIPELKTYDLIPIYLKDKGNSPHGLH